MIAAAFIHDQNFLDVLYIVAFALFTPGLAAQGSAIALFVMAVAAAEATVGLAIVIANYRNRRTPLVDEYASMRE